MCHSLLAVSSRESLLYHITDKNCLFCQVLMLVQVQLKGKILDNGLKSMINSFPACGDFC